MEKIRLIKSQEDIRRCYDVMHELRTHLSGDEFVSQVGRQMDRQGYKLACLEAAGDVWALAGFRFFEMLAWGRVMYIDDLVTAAHARSKGYGGRLFDWLVELGQRTLNPLCRNDLHQELVAPAGDLALSLDAVL